jgi:hypothetical protein
MKQIIYLLLAAAITVSCSSKKEKEPHITFNTSEYKEVANYSDTQGVELEALIPIAEGDSAIAKNINDRIFAAVKSIISQEDDNSTNYTELFKNFTNSYTTFIKDYPDAPGAWEATIKGTVEHNSTDIINVKLDSYTMTGGAHGMGYNTSFLFSPKTGKELFIKDIVSDTTALTQIAEQKFRTKYNIPPSANINSTGLMFENDKFVLPQNIFITKEGLLLLYNSYEIAAYAEGTKEILIPYNEISKHLLIDLKK